MAASYHYLLKDNGIFFWGEIHMISKSKVTLALLQMLFVLLLMISVTLAWITATDRVDSNLFSELTNIEAEYDLYIYQDEQYLGNQTPTLINNYCTVSEQMNCYSHADNLESIQFIQGSRKIYPNDRLSLAIKITNIGTQDVSLSLALSNLLSQGQDYEYNKIQTAMTYTVTKIAYFQNDSEGLDMKDTESITYAGMNEALNYHFGLTDNTLYSLASNIPLSFEGSTVSVVIYFDIYFDPIVESFDEFGFATGNSNAFQNQSFTIGKIIIYMN